MKNPAITRAEGRACFEVQREKIVSLEQARANRTPIDGRHTTAAPDFRKTRVRHQNCITREVEGPLTLPGPRGAEKIEIFDSLPLCKIQKGQARYLSDDSSSIRRSPFLHMGVRGRSEILRPVVGKQSRELLMMRKSSRKNPHGKLWRARCLRLMVAKRVLLR